MKNFTHICLFITLFVTILLLASCENPKDKNNVNNTSFYEHMMDDVKTLEHTLTKEYDLNELILFFNGRNANERLIFASTASPLSFSEVNSKYPVEILRTGNYSVYRVRQGGYFYVFWVQPFVTDTNRSKSEATVYFSSYLPSGISPNSFDSLTSGVSTAEDVKEIDPSFEISFLLSSGIFSYSFIDDKTIMQIEYTSCENIDGYDDLVVKEKKIVAMDSVPTRYSVLLSCDIPKPE